MCGIFGIVNTKKVNFDNARKSVNLMCHRGPDQYGEWSDSKVYMGHRRLSILDISENGKQPMLDNNVVITVNGEIYNYKELRNELIRKYSFNSDSDSEVVLYGYQEWGIKGLIDRIDGMYAISIYDVNRQRVFLIRDRVGIKPLYFGHIKGEYIWASELKPIEDYYGKENLEIDYTSLYDFLTYSYIPSPKSMYKNVYKIKPAHYVEIDLKKDAYSWTQYWNLKTDEIDIGIEEAANMLRALLSKSIAEQLVSDVPLGFFLSGGLDSSVVVALASNTIKDIEVNSIGFNDKDHDEIKFAKIVADKFEANHNISILSKEDVSNCFGELRRWYTEPFGDTSAFPTYLVSEYTRKNATVALTGDGGDEVFGGYNWYSKFKKIKNMQNSYIKLPQNIIYLLKKNLSTSPLYSLISKLEYFSLKDDLEVYTKLMGGMLKHEKKQYRKKWKIDEDYDDYWYFREYYKEGLSDLKRLQYLDFHTYLHDDILTKVDRVSMRTSLEARVPLLSKDIIEFMFSLPEDIIYYNNELKGLLKYTFRDTLPSEIIDRGKRGFSIPYNKWKNHLTKHTSKTKQEIILEELYEEILEIDFQ